MVDSKIIERERPDALLPTLGGQTGLNTAVALAESGVLEQFGVELIGADLAVITNPMVIGGGAGGVTLGRVGGGVPAVGYPARAYESPSMSATSDESDVLEYVVELVASDGAVRALEGAAWAGLVSATGDAPAPTALISWGEPVAIWTPTFGVREGPAGLDDAARDADRAAYIGSI
jgi:hypothetical protein